MTQRKRIWEQSGFKLGQRVRATVEAFQGGVFKQEDAPVYGEVTGFGKDPIYMYVRREGRRSDSRYHVSLWQHTSQRRVT